MRLMRADRADNEQTMRFQRRVRMGIRLRLLLTIVLMALCAYSSAQASDLFVEGVQSPAWVERAGKREPLSAGMRLSDRDRGDQR
jgi:hypothetical protein